MSKRYTMTIDGKAVSGERTLPVIDPATGKPFAEAPCASEADLSAAVAAAQAAFAGWRQQPYSHRQQLFSRAAEAIAEARDELASLIVSEQGRPRAFAEGEVDMSVQWIRETTALEIPVDITDDSEQRRIEVHHEPLGVVAGIAPWNYPLYMAISKIVHAVLPGNTLVLKPSPFTPLATLRLGELLRDIFPAGVINIINGDDSLGPLMTAHPDIAKISFTGSSATGVRIMQSAANDLKRLTLELGGNDVAIVMPDVDLDEVAPQLFMGAFFNSGQICVATKRLYIHDEIYDALRDKLHAMAREAKVGPGSDAQVMFGPVQNRLQFQRVRDLIDASRNAGLRLLEGGAVPAEGYFVPLTLVDNPPEDARVVVEEAFGPVLPLLRFSDVDDVIARANATQYGLGGSVWCRDEALALRIAHALDSGSIGINQGIDSSPHTPLEGHKKSGFGVENGLPGLLQFTQAKALYIRKKPAA